MSAYYGHLKDELGLVIHLQNDRLHLEQQLPALLALESAPTIVFVLDGTQDDCPQKIKEFRAEYAGEVVVLENSPALGRSASWNQGLKALQPKVEKALLLRPYVLPNDDALLVLNASMPKSLGLSPQIYTTAPTLMTPRGLIAYTGYVFSRGLPRRADTCVPVRFQRANATQDFKALPDDALLTWTFLAFDESMTNSYHDADFGLRVVAGGYRNVYCPSARMDTLVEYAGNRQPTDDLASLNAYFEKYGGLKGLDAFNNAGEYYGSGNSYPAVEMWTQNEDEPKAKIAFFICDFELAGHSRGVLPARMLTMRGYDVMISTWATSSIIDWADVCIFQRQYETVVLERMLEAKAKGKRVLYETDEFFHGLDRKHDAVGILTEDPQRLRNIELMIAAADGLLVGSAGLALQYGRFNKRTTIVETGLDLGLLPKEILENTVRELRIAWCGSRTLDQNNLDAAAAIKELITSSNPSVTGSRPVKLVIFGIDYRALFHDVDPKHIEFVPATFDHEDPLSDFHRLLNEACIDIAVVPSGQSVADRVRTDFDLVQLGAFGIAMIASDIEPFKSFQRASTQVGTVMTKSVLLARSARDWKNHLKRLSENATTRRVMGEQVQRYVWTQRGLDKTADALEPAIARALAGDVHVSAKPEPTHSLPISFYNGLTAKKAAEQHAHRRAVYQAMLEQATAKVTSEVPDEPDPNEHQ